MNVEMIHEIGNVAFWVSVVWAVPLTVYLVMRIVQEANS